eukprot:757851-Hanusia_phi.AAC.1
MMQGRRDGERGKALREKERKEDEAERREKDGHGHLSEAIGFQAVSQSALDTLTEVRKDKNAAADSLTMQILIKYIEEVGFQSHSLAELAGRTQVPLALVLSHRADDVGQDNLLDLKSALQDVGTTLPELYL